MTDAADPALHLGVALDGAGWHPAAWREPSARPDELFDARYWADLARTAERGGLDLITIEDTLTLQSSTSPIDPAGPDERTDQVRGRLDASLVASRLATATEHIGLVPVVTTTHTEPFHVAKAVATLDHVSHGRGGWQVRVGGHGAEAALFGRRQFEPIDLAAITAGTLPDSVAERFDEAVDAVEVVRRLWDSWEDDAEIRDVATRRFIDRDKVHTIDFQGRWFSVRGPGIVPRSPQGQPVVAVLAHQRVPYELAARSGDLVFVTPPLGADAVGVLADVRAAEAAVGRDGAPLQVWADLVVLLDGPGESAVDRLARLDERAGSPLTSDAAVAVGSAAALADQIETWHRLGYAGVRLRPAVATDDLPRIVDDLAPELQRRGLVRSGYREATLRGHLGLPTTVPNRYAAV
ncbi:LLM class flavin-dependent oxidoreductase [Nakamurella leprariae]|uniref:LLM class flavin-dependent oxidoreductase n=1 Tax=Nakamurella leprariae TaxID=2803911 RepID=A0A938YA26_9ACTN|nr:LLM class flavin-dependent oxidoreductase [Nakamurella leprariae]MBM9465838.1 LLM class flavin-dependent oxidoreductase [Nakamurella leprariae]